MKRTVTNASAALALAAMLLAAGCGSTPPTRHYLLSAEAESAAGQPVVDRIGVGPVEVAEYLHQRQLAIGGGNELQLAEFHRWAEPLDAGIARVLAENLALLTGGTEPVLYPWRRDDQPPVTVRVSVLKLERQDGSAELLARWGLYDSNDDARLAGELARLSTSLPAGADHAATAAAYSDLLLQLSQRVAAALNTAR